MVFTPFGLLVFLYAFLLFNVTSSRRDTFHPIKLSNPDCVKVLSLRVAQLRVELYRAMGGGVLPHVVPVAYINELCLSLLWRRYVHSTTIAQIHINQIRQEIAWKDVQVDQALLIKTLFFFTGPFRSCSWCYARNISINAKYYTILHLI